MSDIFHIITAISFAFGSGLFFRGGYPAIGTLYAVASILNGIAGALN